MNTSIKNPNNVFKRCIYQAFAILTSIILLGYSFRGTPGFFVFLFIGGWLAWTFVEYCVHRFLMHELILPKGKKNIFNHQRHHQHPAELDVKPIHRLGIFAVFLVILTISIRLNSSFTIFAGFFTGFLFYNFLHYLLHQPFCKYLLPQIQRNHILHHTRYPNHGYSFSTSFWDFLFGTLPPKEAKITARMQEHFFHKSTKKIM